MAYNPWRHRRRTRCCRIGCGHPHGIGTGESKGSTVMRVFISHSSNDVEVARLLINLLQKALHLRSDEIRCTSVDGYRMHAGVGFDEALRAEVHQAELLIGLITRDSAISAYVLFELGARWGAEKPMIPLLASGATFEHLGGPLAGINALDARERGQVHQLLEDTAEHLGVPLDRSSSYESEIDELVQEATQLVATVRQQPTAAQPLQLSEQARALLLEAARGNSSKGMILMVKSFSGLEIRANGKDFVGKGDSRSEAIWKGALQDLLGEELIEDVGGNGTVFVVTNRGYEVADELTKS